LRDRAKNDIVLYHMIFQKCIGLDMFSWIRHDVAEVYTLPRGPSSYPRRRIRRGYYIWVRFFVCLSVCLSAQKFRVFLRNRSSYRDEIFTIGANTHVECWNDYYDVKGHGVWQPYWKIGKKQLWTSASLKPHQRKFWDRAVCTSFWDRASMPSLWRHNCIWRIPHQMSMKIFEGHLGIKWSTGKKSWCHRSRDSAVILFKTQKPSKTFSEVAEQIEVKLYTYDRLSMRNKSFTHMMSLVTWFGSHIGFILKPIKIFSRTAGQIKGKLHTSVPQAMVVLLRGRVSATSTTTRWSSRVGSTDHPECIGRHPG